MSIRTFLAVLRAASRQAVTDLRSSLVAMSVALLASVSAIVVVGRHTQMNAEAHATFGPMFLASSIGTISCFHHPPDRQRDLHRPYRWCPAAGARPAPRPSDVGNR